MGRPAFSRATIKNSNIVDNTTESATSGAGITAGLNSRVSVYNSTISNNYDGIVSDGGTSIAFVFASNVANNRGNGMRARNSGSIAAASTMVVANSGLGIFSELSGGVYSFGNNFVNANEGGNGTFSPPTLTPTSKTRRF